MSTFNHIARTCIYINIYIRGGGSRPVSTLVMPLEHNRRGMSIPVGKNPLSVFRYAKGPMQCGYRGYE